MSAYNPPYEDVAIFDSIYFSAGDEFITQSQADKRYLRFPNAQGTENLQAINVNGLATFNANSTFNAPADFNETTTMGKPLTFNGTLDTDRVINNVYYQLQDKNSLATTTGQIYAATGVFNYDNDINGGSHTFATNTAGGVQTTPLTFNSVDMTIATTNPPTQTAVQPPFTDSSNKIPTTAWVQGAIASGATADVVYTTAGTYTLTKPSGYNHLKIIAIGAGGGGGGGVNMGEPPTSAIGGTGGAGGGGGGVTIADFELTIETSFTIVVGAGGAGGAKSSGANASNGGNGGDTYVRCNQNNLYYAYSTGGSGGQGAINSLLAGNTTQPSGGAGGAGSQGVGGAGGKGKGVGTPTATNTGFAVAGTIGGQSSLIGPGGGGGGGAIFQTGTSGSVYLAANGALGGSMGYTLCLTNLQGQGQGGPANSFTPATTGSTILGVGGGGAGGGGGSAFSGASPTPIYATAGANGVQGSGGGGGGSDHNLGANGGNGGDGVVVLFFS